MMDYKSIMAFISKSGILLYLLTSLIPLSKSDFWFIRIWDFPRLQLLILALLLGLTFILTEKKKSKSKIFLMACLLIGIGFDLYRVLPYSVFWPKESVQTKPADRTYSVSFISVNVLQKNEKSGPLLEMIKKKSPDLVFLLEVNKRWINDLAILNKIYPHQLLRPLENTYGLALYSKLELEEAQVRELIEKDIPSIYAKVKLRSGDKVELFGLHPRPPHYKTVESTERDAELIQVAQRVENSKLPVIVMGDLNDVAWSHTTRLFRRLSNLLDPRVGRSSFPTFPVNIPFLRFPLDYFFHSDELTLVSIKRLSDIGSDHYPMFIELNLAPKLKSVQEGPSKNEGDEKEASETLQKARKE